jgi:hypothetical protein
MKKILALTLMTFLVGCSGNNQEYNIADVTKPETIMLKKVSSQGNIYSMTVVGRGYLDGTAEIVLILNGKPYKTESLSGDVDFSWGGDWYSDSAKVEYKPSSVKSGNLSLKYKFEDI